MIVQNFTHGCSVKVMGRKEEKKSW